MGLHLRGVNRGAATLVSVAVLLAGCASGAGDPGSSGTVTGATGSAPGVTGDPATIAKVEAVARQAMTDNNLKAVVIRVTRDGQDLYTGAMGESMTGVPARPDMRWRNGAFAFTYIGEIFAKLVDEKKVSLDDTLATWLPQLPAADQVTVRNLLNMTSGYADYVRQPEFQAAFYRDPFRQWSNQELIDIGVGKPMYFAPGSNWAYSHTNYVILTEVLAKITGRPMADVMQDYVIGPMGLTSTGDNAGTPAIPDPVLHSFTSERRSALGLPADVPFYEDSTFWNPSWTTGAGAVQTTDIYDVTTSMTVVGSGAQVSPETYREQTGKNLVGFGAPDPTGQCPGCRANTEEASYGLGVILRGPWITQTKDFAGSGATAGYLPSQKLTISVVTTFRPEAFGPEGDPPASDAESGGLFRALAAALVPDTPVPS